MRRRALRDGLVIAGPPLRHYLFVLLTKVTPGVGLLWFVVRREWRPLLLVGAATGLIVAASLVVDGPLWWRWLDRQILTTLRTAPDQPQIEIPLAIRLLVSVVLVAWGARTDRRWTVPAAAALAMPVLWIAAFSVLAAIPAVGRPELRETGSGLKRLVMRP